MSVDFMDSWSVFRFAKRNPDLDFPKIDSLMVLCVLVDI